MFTPTITICGCCGQIVPPSQTTYDIEIDETVCVSCWRDLRHAKAVLALPVCASSADGPAIPINLQGCYRSSDAPDNL